MIKRIFSFLVLLSVSVMLVQAQSRFALLTDIHVTPGARSEKALSQIVDEINGNSALDFVILSGDLSNMGSAEELECVKRIVDKLRIPLYAVPGNHESNWSQSAGRKFNELWGNDRFLFRHGGGVFIGFSTGPYMKMGDGHVKREDILWLDEMLKKEITSGTRLYVIAHYPLMDGLSNYRDVLAVLDKYPVITQFCGHHHLLRELDLEGMKCVIGRAMYTEGEQPGYNLVTLTADSVFYDEKVLGMPAERRFAFANDNKSSLYSEKVNSVVPEDIELPEDMKLELVYTDHASLFSGLAIDKQRIYWTNSLGEVKALSKEGCTLDWSFSTGSSLYSSPCAAKGKVVVPATDGRIYGLNARTGKNVWTVVSDGPFVADGKTDGNFLYQGGFKCFYKVNLRNGRVIWKSSEPDNYCQAQPVLTADRVLFGAWDTYLFCLDRKSGDVLWKWNNGGDNRMLSPGNCVPVVADEHVIVVAPDRYMTAIDLKTGSQLWRNHDFKYRESIGSSIDGNRAYAKTMDGELVAVSSRSDDFQLDWIVDIGIGYEHTPSPVLENEGVVYVGSRAGIVTAVDTTTRRILWRKKCGNSAVNRFDLDRDGTIYFTLIEGKIFKITKK